MTVPARRGQVRDIRPGQVAYAAVGALRRAGESIHGGACLYDGPLATACVRLEGQYNGCVTASLHGDALDQVWGGGGAGDRHRRPAANNPCAAHATYATYLQRAAELLATYGPRSLEIAGRRARSVAGSAGVSGSGRRRAPSTTPPAGAGG